MLLEFDAVGLIDRLDLYDRVRLVGSNPGATSYDPATKQLSTANWLTPSPWIAHHPRGRAPQEMLVRDGLPSDLLHDLLIEQHEL